MSQLFTDIGLHPAILIYVLLVVLPILTLLLRAPRAERAALLPTVAAGALLTAVIGIGLGARVLYQIFSSMALTGSGGEGAVAAGLSEVRAVVLCGVLGTALILLFGLALARPVPQPAVEEGEPRPQQASLRWLMIATTVLALCVAALAVEDLRLSSFIPPIVSTHLPKPAMTTGDASAALSAMLIRTLLGCLLLGPAALVMGVLAIVRNRRQAPPRGIILWGQGLLAVLLVFAIVDLVVCYGMHARFVAAAMTGHF